MYGVPDELNDGDILSTRERNVMARVVLITEAKCDQTC